ncbi:hypothetical protein LSPCS325_38390 [Lysinibacillus sp. CTST325]
MRKRSDSYCYSTMLVTKALVITGHDGFSLRSSIANPQGVAQSPFQSTLPHEIRLTKVIPFWK